MQKKNTVGETEMAAEKKRRKEKPRDGDRKTNEEKKMMWKG